MERAREHVIVYVPQDAGAFRWARIPWRAIDAGARARGRHVRRRAHGLARPYWLEPLVEVATPAGRIAYGPGDRGATCPNYSTRAFSTAPRIRCGSATSRRIRWLASQQRLTGARLGIVDPASLDDYVAHGGYAGLEAALALAPRESCGP